MMPAVNDLPLIILMACSQQAERTLFHVKLWSVQKKCLLLSLYSQIHAPAPFIWEDHFPNLYVDVYSQIKDRLEIKRILARAEMGVCRLHGSIGCETGNSIHTHHFPQDAHFWIFRKTLQVAIIFFDPFTVYWSDINTRLSFIWIE